MLCKYNVTSDVLMTMKIQLIFWVAQYYMVSQPRQLWCI